MIHSCSLLCEWLAGHWHKQLQHRRRWQSLLLLLLLLLQQHINICIQPHALGSTLLQCIKAPRRLQQPALYIQVG
jgi:hypothetical protein